jgi:hypothetical protein
MVLDRGEEWLALLKAARYRFVEAAAKSALVDME